MSMVICHLFLFLFLNGGWGLVLSIRRRSAFWSTFCLVTPVVRSTAFACRTLPTASATVAIEFATTTLSSLAFSFATFTSFTFATFAALFLSRLVGLVSAILGTVITTLVALPTCRTIVFLLANLTLGLFLFRFCSLRRGVDRFGNDSKSIVSFSLSSSNKAKMLFTPDGGGMVIDSGGDTHGLTSAAPM